MGCVSPRAVDRQVGCVGAHAATLADVEEGGLMPITLELTPDAINYIVQPFLDNGLLHARAKEMHHARLMLGEPCPACWELAAAALIRERLGQLPYNFQCPTSFAREGPPTPPPQRSLDKAK